MTSLNRSRSIRGRNDPPDAGGQPPEMSPEAVIDQGRDLIRHEAKAVLQLASRLGLDGTPAMFVNGRPLVGGAVPYEMLAELIDDELARLGR